MTEAESGTSIIINSSLLSLATYRYSCNCHTPYLMTEVYTMIFDKTPDQSKNVTKPIGINSEKWDAFT